jgi:hypothetical protein
MTRRLITIRSVEGRLLASKILTNAANVEYHSEQALSDTVRYFDLPVDQLTLTLQENCESFQEVPSEVA